MLPHRQSDPNWASFEYTCYTLSKGCQLGQDIAKLKTGAQSAHRLISTGTGQHSRKYSTAPGAYFHFSVLTLASLFVARTSELLVLFLFCFHLCNRLVRYSRE